MDQQDSIRLEAAQKRREPNLVDLLERQLELDTEVGKRQFVVAVVVAIGSGASEAIELEIHTKRLVRYLAGIAAGFAGHTDTRLAIHSKNHGK